VIRGDSDLTRKLGELWRCSNDRWCLSGLEYGFCWCSRWDERPDIYCWLPLGMTGEFNKPVQ
jgi:hypothetical protein